MADKPIPAFYCCYLLRSKNRKSYYIGSTPNPQRRLTQHNGGSKGGAKRTSMQGRRPWEMTCIISGFPSKSAALQFEWAWQNTHATRHIDRDVRDARLEGMQRKKGKAEGQPSKNKRPPMSLEARLKNLRYLTGVNSFRRWPLQIQFFATDVFEVWGKHSKKMPLLLRQDVTVQLTPAEKPSVTAEQGSEEHAHGIPAVIRAIPITYGDTKKHLEKAKTIFEDGRPHRCGLCKKLSNPSSSLVLVCPLQDCGAVYHIQCLSAEFLSKEHDQNVLLPTNGSCPECRGQIKWATLMKELSLRTRGQEEVDELLKTKRTTKADKATELGPKEPNTCEEADDDLDDTWMQDVEDEGDELPHSDINSHSSGRRCRS